MPKKLKLGLKWRGFPLFFISQKGGITFQFVSENSEIPSDFDEDKCIRFHSKFTWANVAHSIGMFESASAARKCGWAIPIESGFNEAFFSLSNGTPIFVYIWN